MKHAPWLALLAAFVPRLLFVALAPAPTVESDASGYDAAARRLVATGTYAFPVGRALWSEDIFREDAWHAYLRMPSIAWAMPGYSLFLAGIYQFSGTGPGRLTTVRVVQAVLGAATVALVFRIADSLLGRRAAWAAVILNAFYPPSLSLAGYLLTETLFTFLLAGPRTVATGARTPGPGLRHLRGGGRCAPGPVVDLERPHRRRLHADPFGHGAAQDPGRAHGARARGAGRDLRPVCAPRPDGQRRPRVRREGGTPHPRGLAARLAPRLIAGVVVYVVLVHWRVGFLTPRYLYPTMPLLLTLAGAAVAAFLPGRGGPRAGEAPR